jgi:hypothetical protein
LLYHHACSPSISHAAEFEQFEKFEKNPECALGEHTPPGAWLCDFTFLALKFAHLD